MRMLSALDTRKTLLVISRRGCVKRIRPGKWFIDRKTPVGEDADIYELKAYGGKKLIKRERIIGNE